MNKKLKLPKFLNKKNAIIIIIICICALAFMKFFPQKNEDVSSDRRNREDFKFSSEYKKQAEKELKSLVSGISGAGKTEVYVSVSDSGAYQYGKNNENKSGSDISENKSEYAVYKTSNSENPLEIKKLYPEIKGVSVICEGADNEGVKISIINSVKAYTGVTANRISVEKMVSAK